MGNETKRVIKLTKEQAKKIHEEFKKDVDKEITQKTLSQKPKKAAL